MRRSSGTLALDGVDLAGRAIERVRGELSGTRARAHGRAADRVEGPAAGVGRRDRDAAQRGRADGAGAPPSADSARPARPRPRPRTAASRSVLVMSLEGGLVDAGGERAGRLERHAARAASRKAWQRRPHLAARARRCAAATSGAAARRAPASSRAAPKRSARRCAGAASPGRRGDGRGGGARLDAAADHRAAADRTAARARRSPTSAGAATSRSRARLEVHSAPTVRVDIVVERAQRRPHA